MILQQHPTNNSQFCTSVAIAVEAQIDPIPFGLPDESINIRHAEAADSADLHHILTTPEVAHWTIETPYTSVEAIKNKLFASDQGHYTIVAVDAAETVLGLLGLSIYTSPRIQHVAKVGPVAVHPAIKGKGIGSKLMAAGISLADEWLNLRRLELLVYANNQAAIALYKKFGFVIEGTLHDFAFQAGDYVDAYVMARLRLDQQKDEEFNIKK